MESWLPPKMWKTSFHIFICSKAEENFPQKQNSIVLQMNMWKNVFHVFGGSQLSMEHCFPLKKMEDWFPFSHEFVLTYPEIQGHILPRKVHLCSQGLWFEKEVILNTRPRRQFHTNTVSQCLSPLPHEEVRHIARSKIPWSIHGKSSMTWTKKKKI